MNYLTKYSGPIIDQALEKALNWEEVPNGFIKILSTESSPYDLNTIKNPGNYQIVYTTNGPSQGLMYRPINLYVSVSEDVTYQMVRCFSEWYVRFYDIELDKWTEWELSQTEAQVIIDSTAPTNPSENTVWIDTSHGNPIIKKWNGSIWLEYYPDKIMMKSIYDKNNMNTDFFDYVDKALADIAGGDIGTIVNNHINDSTIHVTPEEKTKWNNAASREYLSDEVSAMEDRINSALEDKVSSITKNIAASDSIDVTRLKRAVERLALYI